MIVGIEELANSVSEEAFGFLKFHFRIGEPVIDLVSPEEVHFRVYKEERLCLAGVYYNGRVHHIQL